MRQTWILFTLSHSSPTSPTPSASFVSHSPHHNIEMAFIVVRSVRAGDEVWWSESVRLAMLVCININGQTLIRPSENFRQFSNESNDLWVKSFDRVHAILFIYIHIYRSQRECYIYYYYYLLVLHVWSGFYAELCRMHANFVQICVATACITLCKLYDSKFKSFVSVRRSLAQSFTASRSFASKNPKVKWCVHAIRIHKQIIVQQQKLPVASAREKNSGSEGKRRNSIASDTLEESGSAVAVK